MDPSSVVRRHARGCTTWREAGDDPEAAREMVAESEGEDRATMQAEVQQLTAKRAGLEAEQERAAQERADERQGQIGTGDRSEKIRTYNIPQARITDHRIGLSVHNVEAVLGGELDEIVAALRQAEREARLADLDD